MNPKERAKYLLEHNNLMTIATADSSGKPWVSTVGFSYDESFNLYWVSHMDHLHSRNVRARPQVGIVIFGTIPPDDMDGIYFDAEAKQLDDEEDILKGMAAMSKSEKSDKFIIHSIEDVSGKACWRVYRATAKEVTKR